jgi:hypothetical protein
MKNIFIFIAVIVIFAMPMSVFSQKSGWPKNVTVVASKSRGTASVSGDLASGAAVTDLSWAWNSSNACFVATQAQKFMGNHVFFATTLPAQTVMTVSLKPDDESANMSLYGYMLGADSFYLVPDLPSSVTCESDQKWDRPWKNRVQTSERKMEFRNPTQNTYNILIGVSAPKGTTSGKFKVDITGGT